MTAAEITLDKRRFETWYAIHQAAATLAMEQGPAQATIDAIAEMAGISRRTFFNYFPTKEDAVLGLESPEIPADALAKFQEEEDDLLAGLVHFMIAVLRTSYRLAPDLTGRQQLIKKFPELRLRQIHYAGLVESMIAPVLREKLTDTVAENIDIAATAMLMLARTIMQFAYSQHPVPAPVTDEEIDAAIATFRRIIEDNR